MPGKVWKTSPPLVMASVVLRLFRALLPLATLWVSKLILDAVVNRITRGSGTLAQIWKLVALELALPVASDLPGRASTLCDSLLADRFTGGAIQEQGTHEQLLAPGGRYAGLFELQAAGYR